MSKKENEKKHSAIFRVASLPGTMSVCADGSQYVTLFYGALKPHDVDCVAELTPNRTWLEKHAQFLDAIHIHWPERIWRSSHWRWASYLREIRGYYWLRRFTNWPRSFLGLRYLQPLLDCAKKQRLRIIWTVHDLVPHEKSGKLDRIGYRILARQSDLIICHSESARNSFTQEYGAIEKTIVMHHGNFSGVYPAPRSRVEVFRDIGLSEKLPMVCFLGLLRRYKGIDLCLDALAQLDGRVQLVIAGLPHSDFNVSTISSRVSQMKNVVFIPKFLSSQEFADYASASEAFLLPYQRITTSGVLHAAFTFHRGVIASDLPYFQEYLLDNPNYGRLFKMGDSSDFARAIEEYVLIPHRTRSHAIKKFTEHFSWARVTMPVSEKIKEWVKEDGLVSDENDIQ